MSAILAQRLASDPLLTWEAHLADRGQLSVVAVIQPSAEPIVVELPSEAELRELLTRGGTACGSARNAAK